MGWITEWVGLPYRECGRGPAYDCLGLFLALQEVRQGRELPDPACTVAEAVRRRVVDGCRPQWVRVDEAQEGDALLFRIGGRVSHVAYAVSRRDMLHTHATTKQSTLDRFTGLTWAPFLEGIYRYAA